MKLKAAVCKFCLFVAISVENLELQLCVELSSLCGLCSGSAPARMNLMIWGECVAVSHRTGVDIYCTLQSQILAYVLEYMTQITIFTVYCHLNKKVTSLPCLFWPTEEKRITINCANNDD